MTTVTMKMLLKKISAYLIFTSLLMPLMAADAWAATAAAKPGGGGSAAAGATLYKRICFACHGNDGGGRFARRSIKDKTAASIKGPSPTRCTPCPS